MSPRKKTICRCAAVLVAALLFFTACLPASAEKIAILPAAKPVPLSDRIARAFSLLSESEGGACDGTSEWDLVALGYITGDEVKAYAEGDATLPRTFASESDRFFRANPDVFYIDPARFTLRMGRTAYAYRAVMGPGSDLSYLRLSGENRAAVAARVSAYEDRLSSLAAACSATTDDGKIAYVNACLARDVSFVTAADRKADPAAEAFYATAYGAWVLGKADAEGYAMAAKALFDRLGVTAAVVSGYLKTGEDLYVNHAWNVVTVGGANYGFDAALNDATPYAAAPGAPLTMATGAEMADHLPDGRVSASGDPLVYPALSGDPAATPDVTLSRVLTGDVCREINVTAPVLLDNAALPIYGWGASTRDRLTLVARETDTETESRMITLTDANCGAGASLAAAGYRLSLQTDGTAAMLPDYSYLRVALPYPAGYTAASDVTYRVWYFEENDGILTSAAAQSAYRAEGGLLTEIRAGGVYAVVVHDRAKVAAARTVYARTIGLTGGTAEDGIGRLIVEAAEKRPASVSLQPFGKQVVSVAALNGELTNPKNNAFSFAYYELEESNLLEISFVAFDRLMEDGRFSYVPLEKAHFVAARTGILTDEGIRPAPPPDPDPDAGLPLWPFIAGGAVLLSAAIAFVFVFRKKHP